MMMRRMVDILRSALVSVTWLALLLVTTVLQRTAAPERVAAWLAASSTDISHLVSDPVAVLLSSLAWLDGAYWLPYAVMFAVVVIPMERRLGVRRWAALGLAGHIVGTGVSQGALWVAIAVGATSSSQMSMRDIGVSYAIFAFVGGAAQFVEPQWRRAFATTVVALAGVTLVVDPSVTTLGHLVAITTGLLLGPVIVGPQVVGPGGAGAQVCASRFFSCSTSKSGAGHSRSRRSRASIISSVTARRAYHLRSAGTMCQGAVSTSVSSNTT